MLLHDFFDLENARREDERLDATIVFNAAHPVFGGHFPGQPVVPGVCMMLLVREVVNNQWNRTMALKRANQAKFLTMIDPRVNPVVSLSIQCTTVEKNDMEVSATLFKDDIVFFKYRATLG